MDFYSPKIISQVVWYPETETNSEFTPENGWLECEDLMVTLKYLDIFYIFLAGSLFAQELNICFHIKIL